MPAMAGITMSRLPAAGNKEGEEAAGMARLFAFSFGRGSRPLAVRGVLRGTPGDSARRYRARFD